MTALRSLSLGALLLFAIVLPTSALAQTRTIAPGQAMSGRLQAGDATTSDGSFTHLYLYQGSPGDQITIDLRSSIFDTYLGWGRIVGNNFESVASNDDSETGVTNSRIETTVESGTFAVQVTSFSAGATGDYTVSITRRGGGGAAAADDGEFRTIALGTTNGRFVSSDPTLEDDSHYHVYLYPARAGERLTVTMRSTEVDSYLSGGILDGDDDFTYTESNDDGGGGSDSQFTVTIAQEGVYVIRANTFGEGETGSYTLTLTSNLPPQAGGGGGGGGGSTASGTITPGSTVSGRLTTNSARLTDDSYYQAYRYQAQAGERIRITMNSDDFDTYLFWGSVSGNTFTSIDTDDDDGDGTNSYIEIQVADAGLYEIRANSYAADQTGEFTLLLESDAVRSGPTIARGQTVSDRLTAADPTLTDNSHYKLYTYYGTPGEQVIVTMRSSFDTYLAAGRMVGGNFVQDLSDDDSGGGTDSQLVAEIGGGGSLVIRANSYSGGVTGDFTLSVQPAGGAVASPSTPLPAGTSLITLGSPVNGALQTSDLQADDGSFVDQYVYRGSPGDRIRITLTSSVFDTYLRGGRLDNTDFTEEVTNDDIDYGNGNTNSRLEVTVGGTGQYAIRANSFGEGVTGAYSLLVERMTASSAPSTSPTPAPTASGTSGKWNYVYLTSTDGTYQNLGNRLRSWRILESVTNELDSRGYALPRNIDVRIAECDEINAFYSPRDVQITFCYELVDWIADMFVESPGDWTAEEVEAVDGAFRFIIMHEVGHALVHQLDLGITGREEDAVDQLAALIMIQGGDKGAIGAYNGVMSIQPDDNNFDEWEFAGEHSLGPQRLYNVLCWIYGSDPDGWESIVTDGLLPEDRAVRCPGEYDRMQKAWTRLLATG